MSHNLNSLKEGIIYGTTIGDIKRDTRSLDYSSDIVACFHRPCPVRNACAFALTGE